MNGLTISKFIQSKQITKEDLDDNFVNISETSGFAGKSCPNCGDKINCRSYPTESWCSVRWCVKCGTISHIIHADRMDGNHHDYITIYQAKNG